MRQTDEDDVRQSYQEAQKEFYKAEREKFEQRAR